MSEAPWLDVGMTDIGGVPGAGSGGGMDWGSLLSAILPGIGSLFGGGISSSLNQMQGSESQMASQLMSMIGGLNNDFSKYYQPAMGAESSNVIGDLGATQGNIAGSNAVYDQMAKTGLSPQVQTNAQNQLLQGFDSSLSDIKANATPGGNTASQMQNAQNQYLTSSANQSAQLAGESQQMKAQGAAGLSSNAFGALNAANAFTGQGIQMEGMGMSSLDSLYSSLAQQSAAYAQASGGSQGLGGGLGSILGLASAFF